jgi:OmpA-OmpF porin, OOP family
MSKKTTIPLYVFLALAVSAPGVYAKVLNEPYLGVGYGQYNFETDRVDFDFDDDREALKVYGGIMFTKSLGAEITWYDFDEARDNFLRADLEGSSIAGVFNAPLHDRFAFFAKVGWFFWDVDLKTDVFIPGIAVVNEDFDGDDVFFGVGAQIGLTESLDLRFEYERFDIDDEAIRPEFEYASVSLQANF